MIHPDREDALARALDILPTGDPANSDPRLLRDAALVEEARAARETAADVWLAVSPLRAAPPDVLNSVLEKIGTPPPAARERPPRIAPLLAASGWAAAAAIAICLWPREAAIPVPVMTAIPKETPRAKAAERNGISISPASGNGAEESQLRKELMRLRSAVATLRQDETLAAPRVMSLSAPGGIRRSPEEARQRVWAVLTSALRSSLEVESGAPGDPATLVIERGWLPDGITLPADGALRHRNFPEDSWNDLGLLRSEDGSFYDPAHGLVWTKDAEGRGFLGRKATEETDLASYKPATSQELASVAKTKPRTQAEGFVIEDPVTNKAEVVIDQVPPPADGHQQTIVWKDVSGATGSMAVGSIDAAAASGVASTGLTFGNFPFSSDSLTPIEGGLSISPGTFSSSRLLYSGGYTYVFTIPNSGGLTSFQLIETPLGSTGVVAAPRVIVSGGQ